jgi:lycopene cyclase domain-containing protein
MYLYLLLNLGSISIPLLYSFNKKMSFIKQWKTVFMSIILVATFFIVWDVIFTENGIWGFNEAYHLPYKIAGLPIDEMLFFICIPYASIFIHYSLEYFKPKLLLSSKAVGKITFFLLILTALTLFFNLDKWYTSINYSLLIVTLLVALFLAKDILKRFYIAFVIILIPFLIVNGILTGSFIPEPVVWYNDLENLGIRLFTIPIEDIGYAFNMLFWVVFLNEQFKKSNFLKTE